MHARPNRKEQDMIFPLYDFFLFCLDAQKRFLLFVDALQKKGDQQQRLEMIGDPDIFAFDYQVVISGEDLEEPINYDLVQVAGNWSSERRPIIIIDPRAGRGPWISGTDPDSQVGEALKLGHPVYCIPFRQSPEKGQDMPSVFKGISELVRVVAARHPHAKPPVLVANCQAGWMVAIAVRRYLKDLHCPKALVGAPLSYWGGTEGMKYKGMLAGGSCWVTGMGDADRGEFQGANLSLNFEINDGSAVIGKKNLDLYFNPNQQAIEGYLQKEKWWNFFCDMTTDEISWITSQLFVGNKLEQLELVIEEELIDLRDETDPIVIFASFGDTITPPFQALGWITALYQEPGEIKRPIVYTLHPDCGHLGIFVSKKIALLQHKTIFERMSEFESLDSGIYELVFDENGASNLQPRTLADIRSLDDREKWEDQALQTLARLSRFYESAYGLFLRPWIKAMAFEKVASFQKTLHPMRSSRMFFSSRNPFMSWVNVLANFIKPGYEELPPEKNIFKQIEKNIADQLVEIWRTAEKNSGNFSRQIMKLFYYSTTQFQTKLP